MTPKACPGMVLGDLGAPFGVRRVIFKEFLRRLARRWAQDGRSWGQVGSKLRPRWAKIAPSWRSWAQLARFWEHVRSILAHGLDGRKLTKTKGKHNFFGILGCLKRWLKHFFGDVGAKMAFFRHLGSTCGTCWRKDGQQDGQDGQHEGQDGRKEAKMGPGLNSIDASRGC